MGWIRIPRSEAWKYEFNQALQAILTHSEIWGTLLKGRVPISITHWASKLELLNMYLSWAWYWTRCWWCISDTIMPDLFPFWSLQYRCEDRRYVEKEMHLTATWNKNTEINRCNNRAGGVGHFGQGDLEYPLWPFRPFLGDGKESAKCRGGMGGRNLSISLWNSSIHSNRTPGAGLESFLSHGIEQATHCLRLLSAPPTLSSRGCFVLYPSQSASS